ncbi:unnamed protein product, partial [Tetraodon nigroviridis]
ETTFRHFRKVRLKPDQFTSYLTESVGFSSYRLLTHTGRKPARTGKQRPVYLFYKGPAHRNAPWRSPPFGQKKMAAATMMLNAELSVSAKNDVVPDWTSKEVSTGVSVQFIMDLGRTEHCFVL